MRVRKRFAELQAMDEEENCVPWHIVDAAQSVEALQSDINKVVDETISRVADGAPLRKMFADGEYLLPQPDCFEDEN